MKRNFHKHHLLIVALAISLITPLIIVLTQRIPYFLQPSTVYITVRLGQGYWWIPTPSFPPSLAKFLQTNLQSRDLNNQTSAELITVEQYPFITLSNKAAYNTYLTIKLQARPDLSGDTFYYKSQKLLPGEPFSIKFDTISISGTIVNTSFDPPKKETKKYKVSLTKKAAFPWEFNQIKTNSSLTINGNKVFTIREKSCTPTISLKKDFYGQLTINSQVNLCYIALQTEMQLQPSAAGFIFGYDDKIYIGSTISINTNDTFLEKYTVSSIEELTSSQQ